MLFLGLIASIFIKALIKFCSCKNVYVVIIRWFFVLLHNSSKFSPVSFITNCDPCVILMYRYNIEKLDLNPFSTFLFVQIYNICRIDLMTWYDSECVKKVN